MREGDAMKKFLFVLFFVLLLCTILPAASASEGYYAPDLKVSRYTQDTGGFTVVNDGKKNTPSEGFDVLIYYKKFDDTTYKAAYHTNDVIAPGYSKSFVGTSAASKEIKYGLIRVNPYKKFQEQNYDNNIRVFSVIPKKITTYKATEQSMYDGGYYWEYYYYSHMYGHAWKDGNSTVCNNGEYSPLLSTNPIATSYLYWNGRTWVTINQPLYVNAVEILGYYNGKRYKSNYVAVEGVGNNPHMHIYVDVGFAKHLVYNAAKNLWEGYIRYESAKLRDNLIIKIYSDRTGTDATQDIINYVSNVKVYTCYIKNSWSWFY